MPFSDDNTGLIIRYLGPQGPHALLAFVLAVLVFGVFTVRPELAPLAVAFALTIYVLFGYFKVRSDKHAETMLKLEVEKKREEIRADAVAVGLDIMTRRLLPRREVSVPVPEISIEETRRSLPKD